MVAPVTGYYVRTQSLKGPPNAGGFKPTHVEKYQQWKRQKRPYNLILPFYATDIRVIRSISNDPMDYADTSAAVRQWHAGQLADADNKAFSKYIEQVRSSAAMLENFAQRKQAMTMMGDRLLQLATFAAYLKRRDFRSAAKVLYVPSNKIPNGLKGHAKALGSNWLEFHFGWEPAVKDIYAAIDILQRDVPPAKVKGRGTVKIRTVTRLDAAWFEVYEYLTHSTIASEVSVSNPNLWKANQLGLVNPVSVAWELVPFSFVVDWFVNVGDFLNSFTDFVGLNITNPRTTHVQVATFQSDYHPRSYNRMFQSLFIDRATSIAGPTVRAKPFNRISPIRGATACSLLVGFLEDAQKASSGWKRRGPKSPWDDLHARGF
jgi:hypothetical protein